MPLLPSVSKACHSAAGTFGDVGGFMGGGGGGDGGSMTVEAETVVSTPGSRSLICSVKPAFEANASSTLLVSAVPTVLTVVLEESSVVSELTTLLP